MIDHTNNCKNDQESAVDNRPSMLQKTLTWMLTMVVDLAAPLSIHQNVFDSPKTFERRDYLKEEIERINSSLRESQKIL